MVSLTVSRCGPVVRFPRNLLFGGRPGGGNAPLRAKEEARRGFTLAGRQVVDARARYAFLTFEAWRPLGPFVTSNSTLSPSDKLLKP